MTKLSGAQRSTRTKFSEAAQWAQAILGDPQKKEYYRQRAKALKLPNAYTAAITNYMRKPTVKKTQLNGTVTYRIDKPGFALKQVFVANNAGPGEPPLHTVMRQHKDEWVVHYTPDKNNVSPISLVIVDNTGQETLFVEAPNTSKSR